MNWKNVTKSIKDFLIGENMTTELTAKDHADEVLEAKIQAEIDTEDLIDDENEDGDDAEDSDIDSSDEISNEISHEDIMLVCEAEINSCEDHEQKTFFTNIKKFYDGASCEEAKKVIALQLNNKVFKLR